MSWLLSTNKNYTYFVNTVDVSLSLRYPAKDIFYRESTNAIDIMQKFDRSTMVVMQKADIASPIFVDNSALLNWLDGSMAKIAGRCPCCMIYWPIDSMKVLFPTPGVPVMPNRMD